MAFRCSLWGSLLQCCREFERYVNLRPARLMPGVSSPLAGRKPGEIARFALTPDYRAAPAIPGLQQSFCETVDGS